MKNRIPIILLLIITSLLVSALLFAELVTSANAVNQIDADSESNHANSINAAKSFTISFGINPAGSGQIRIDQTGSTYITETVPINDDVTLTPIFDSVEWQFTGWTGTYVTTTSPLPLSATQDYNVTANFTRTCYDLTLGYSGGGAAGSNPTETSTSAFCGPGQYAAGETVSVQAANIETQGWKVQNWSGTDNDSSKLYTNSKLMPGGNHTITVNYEPICYALTVNYDASKGEVTRIPDPDCPVETPGNKYFKGTTVSLTALAADGYEFDSWTGDTQGSADVSPMLVDMIKNRTITAQFDIACHTLTLAHTPSNGASGGDPTATPNKSAQCASANEYVHGQKIALLASPNSGWQVKSWHNTLGNDDSTSISNSLNFPKLPPDTINYIVTVNYIENPTLQFRDNGDRVNESIGQISVYVKRIGSLAETVSVNYATSNGTAKAGQDYVAATGSLTFGPDVNLRTFPVTINDDNIKEGDESFFLTLSNPVDALLGTPSQIEITIADDEGDPTVNFSAVDYETLETSSPTTITVTLFPASMDDVFVTFDTADGGTATNDQDYEWVEKETLHFEPGQTSKTIDIPISDDSLDEPDETVLLELPDIFFAEQGTSEAALTIIDDDEPPNIFFEDTEYYAKEGDLTAPVTVTLSAASGLSITVDFEVIKLAYGRQFEDAILFEPGETSKLIEIPIDEYQANDQLEIVLDQAVNANLVSPSSASLEILDKSRGECHQLIVEKSGLGSLPTTTLEHSKECPIGQFVWGEDPISVYAEPDPGWVVSSWRGTENDNSTSTTNFVTMPDSDHTVTIYYITHAYLPALTREYVSYFDGPDEVEPNNALSTLYANGPIRSGQAYFGSFPSQDDQFDIFYFYLPENGNVQVGLTDIPLGRDYNLYLYSSNAALKGYSGSLENNDEHISSSNLQPGVYYIAIHFASGTPSSSKYKVTATFE